MSQIELQKSINDQIEKLVASEKITKKLLGSLSRDLLEYIVLNGTDDIDMVNRTLLACTPVNRKAATVFFKHFLPFTFSDDTLVFTNKLDGEKRVQKRIDRVNAFMADEKNNLWTWAEDNIQVDKAPTPFADRLQNLTKQALNGTKKQDPITGSEIIAAVLQAGVTIDDTMKVLDQVMKQIEVDKPKLAA